MRKRKTNTRTPATEEERRITKEIGLNMARIRKERGLSQAELADRVGIAQQHISHYERGRLRMHAGALAALARALGVTSDEIIGLRAPEESGIKMDRRFLRRMREVAKLPVQDQKAVLRTVDAFLNEQQARASRRRRAAE